MEGILDPQHGVATILASILVILCLHLLARLGEFVFGLLTHKSKATDSQISKIDLSLTQNTQAVRELRIQIGMLERELSEVHKFKADSQKLFSAVKIMAGKKWPEVRKAMEEEILPK